MRLAALTAAGALVAVSFESDAATTEEALRSLAEFAEMHPGATIAEATDSAGATLSVWREDLDRLRRGELDAHELLGRRPAAFRHRPPRVPGARKRGRR